MYKQIFKQKLESLVETFDRNIDEYKSRKSKFNEAQLREQFLNPMFKALGWDMNNEQGFAEQYKEVVHEDRVEVKGKPKAPDYSFRIGGQRKFFLEAKQPLVKIQTDYDPALQLRRYAWSAHLPISLLTDFEEFSVYDTTIEPKSTDKASVARIEYYTYDQYPDIWETIYDTYAKQSLLKGSFDKYIQKEKKGKQVVDKTFLKEIEKWREWLAKDVAKNNPELSIYELNFAVQKVIDRIIFLRIAEDRGIEDYQTLERIIKVKDSYKGLVRYFKKAHEKYNSSLFDFESDQLTPKLNVSDNLLDKILAQLYYPKSPYEFSVIGVEVLGSIYEQFLGKVIRLTSSHNAVIEEKPEVKKAGGVYYTPQYIVEYIVKNTVGELVKDKTPKQVEKLRILDPACGSGSFLIGAYEYLLDWHLHYYLNLSDKEKEKLEKMKIIWNKGFEALENKKDVANWQLTTNEKKRIMLNNIYGVDIDQQAVEVTKLSLALKMLENENHQTINKQMNLFPERILPDLSSNIKCGNSLVSSDYWDDKDLSEVSEEEIKKVNAFDWEDKFPDIFKEKELQAHMVTWVTHNSRVSERMVQYGVKTGDAVLLDEKSEKKITELIGNIVIENKIPVLAYNVCKDHIHMIIVSSHEDLPDIVRKLKGKSARMYNKWVNPLVDQDEAEYADGSKMHLWAQKFHSKILEGNDALANASEYLLHNREKHDLPTNKGFQPLVQKMVVPYEKAFATQYEGGFDAVIGNPPYIRIQGLQEFSPETVPYLKEKYYSAQSGNIDIYVIFLEKVLQLLSKNGLNGFILPHKFFNADMGKNIREIISSKKAIKRIVSFKEKQIFESATTYTCLFFLSGNQNEKIQYSEQNSDEPSDKFLANIGKFGEIKHHLKDQTTWRFYEPKIQKVMNKLLSQERTLEDYSEKIFQGIPTGADKIYVLTDIEIKDSTYVGYSEQLTKRVEVEKNLFKLFLKGQDVHRYEYLKPDKIVLFPYHINEVKANLMELDFIKRDYPLGYEYLMENKNYLESREKGKFKNTWWQFSRLQSLAEFQHRRIVTPEISKGPNLTIKEKDVAFTTKVYGFKFDKKYEFNDLFFLAILNSPLLWFFLSQTGYVLRGGYYTFKTNYLNPFPMPNFDLSDKNFTQVHHQLVDLVEKQLALHKQLSEVESEQKKKMIQQQIDKVDQEMNQQVYKLYGLSKEEIDIIEETI